MIEVNKMSKTKRKYFRLLTMIIPLLFLSYACSYADATYVKSTEIKCENINVQIKTECLNNVNRPFPFCISQDILFINASDGKSIRKPASGILTKNTSNSIQTLDALVSNIACVKGYKKSYLLIGFYNGGNCDECEWSEIYDLTGKRLVSSREDKVVKGNNEKFKEIYEKLGLPRTWPRNSFVDINLMKNK